MAVDRQLLSPEGLHPAPGFNHIAIAGGSRVAYLSGQVALTPDFQVIAEGNLQEQAAAATRNIGIALEAIGADWDQVVRRIIYTFDATEYEAITAGIESVTGQIDHPAQTIIGVTSLAVPGLLVEIEVTVALP